MDHARWWTYSKYTIPASFYLFLAILAGCRAMTNSDASMDYTDYATREATIEEVIQTLQVDWDEGLSDLRALREIGSEELGRDLYALAWRVGLAGTEIGHRQAMTTYLVEGIASNSSFLRGQALKFLQDFSKDDFDASSRETLEELPWNDEHSISLIRLIGIVNLQTKIPALEHVAAEDWETSNPYILQNSRQWSATLALARMGDIASMDRIVERVRSEPDIVARSSVFFQDLAYTRRQAAFDMLRDYLESTERLPQLKSTVQGELEARYAAALFAEFAVGCPVEGSDVDEEDIPRIRDWAAAQQSWLLR